MRLTALAVMRAARSDGRVVVPPPVVHHHAPPVRRVIVQPRKELRRLPVAGVRLPVPIAPDQVGLVACVDLLGLRQVHLVDVARCSEAVRLVRQVQRVVCKRGNATASERVESDRKDDAP